MLLRQSLRVLRPAPSTTTLNRRLFATMSESSGPVEQTIRKKITDSLQPTRLEIYNDSHLHKHHKAMADSTSAETHFRLVITSAHFNGQRQIKRHRMVNDLLKEDLSREGGIHALQLRTMTPEEDGESSKQGP